MLQILYEAVSYTCFTIGVLILAYHFTSFLLQKFAVIQREYTLSKNRGTQQFISLYDQIKVLKKFKEACELAEIKVSPTIIIFLSILLFFLSFFGSDGFLNYLRIRYATGIEESHHDYLLNTIFAILIGSLPLFFVFLKLQHKRQNIALNMIHVVQNFIGNDHPHLTLGEAVAKAAKTMPPIIQTEWNLLALSLRSKSQKEALYEFAKRVDNEWAEDFADILHMKGEYGVDITASLHKLVRQMQVAKYNEERRQAMISIYRWGTVFMVFAAVFIIIFNIMMDGNNYRYYFLDPGGRYFVAISMIILFGSLMIVALSGRKRI